MGPEQNLDLYNQFAKTDAEPLAAELERTKRAEKVLGQLGAEFEEMPVGREVSEPTILAKLFALSRLANDPLGFIGFSPMSMVTSAESGLAIFATVAPAHDQCPLPTQYNDVVIHTRAMKLLPPRRQTDTSAFTQGDETKYDLEFFGLNIYAEDPRVPIDDVVGEEATAEPELTQPVSSSTIPVNAKAQVVINKSRESTKLIITEGKPLSGITNIFAVRHKSHGTVRLYGITIKKDPEIPEPLLTGYSKRHDNDSNILTVGLSNNLVAEVKVLEGVLFDQVLDEFEKATTAIQAEKSFDDTKTLNVAERFALQNPRGDITAKSSENHSEPTLLGALAATSIK